MIPSLASLHIHNLFIIYEKVHLNMVFLKELRSADYSEDILTNMPTF